MQIDSGYTLKTLSMIFHLSMYEEFETTKNQG